MKRFLSKNLLSRNTLQSLKRSETTLSAHQILLSNKPIPISSIFQQHLYKNFSKKISEKEITNSPASLQQLISPHVQQIIKSQKQFVDSEFPPNNKIFDVNPNVQIPAQQFVTEWKRASDLFPRQNLKLFDGKLDATSLVQGALFGDCWFLCAVAGVAAINPMLINRLFITKSINDAGIYELQLYHGGNWHRVIVDDFFPCVYGNIAIAHSKKPEIWIMLLEKAYAKLYGSYAQLHMGKPNEAFEDLTGFAADFERWDDAAWTRLTQDSLFHGIKESIQKKNFVALGSVGDPNLLQAVGLEPGHTFTVCDAVQVMNHKLLKLWNPWGTANWKGEWSRGCSKWTPELKAILRFDSSDADDGTFWIEMTDVWQHFCGVSTGYYDVNYLFYNQLIHGSFRAGGKKHVGQSFELVASSASAPNMVDVCITIYQVNPRKLSAAGAAKSQPNRALAFLVDAETEQLVADCVPEAADHALLIRASLIPGKKYMLVPWTVDQRDAPFVVRVLGSQAFTLRSEERPFEYATTLNLAAAHDAYCASIADTDGDGDGGIQPRFSELVGDQLLFEIYPTNRTDMMTCSYKPLSPSSKKKMKKKTKKPQSQQQAQQPVLRVTAKLSLQNCAVVKNNNNKEEENEDAEESDDSVVEFIIRPGETKCVARGCPINPFEDCLFGIDNVSWEPL